MTAKPSSAPWADEPLKLIPTPKTYLDVNSHYAVYAASEMAYSHNALIRGLNSILQQGPHILSSPEMGYVKQDVCDLCFYAESWCKMVDHHHDAEETTMFPAIEAMAGEPGLMAGAADQHKLFHNGLHDLQGYAAQMQKTPEEYRWVDMKAIIDGFSEPLITHLRDEIELFLSFDRLDGDGLKKCWDEAERVAKANGNIGILYDIFPCVLGCCDKTYEGGNSFPPLPSVLPYAIKYWFSTYNPGAWRFSPCDWWGIPRPLQMLPENRFG